MIHSEILTTSVFLYTDISSNQQPNNSSLKNKIKDYAIFNSVYFDHVGLLKICKCFINIPKWPKYNANGSIIKTCAVRLNSSNFKLYISLNFF